MSNKPFDAEKVSSCMDGESIEYLSELCKHEKARACWRRFHFIRSVMQDADAAIVLKEDFHIRIIQALENEPTVLAPRSLKRHKDFLFKRILKPAAGLAIAASVAAVAVTGFQNLYPSVPGSVLVKSDQDARLVPERQLAQRDNDNLVSTEAEKILASDMLGDDLDTYLLGHMEQSTSGGNAQGMLPYVRLAGFNDSQ